MNSIIRVIFYATLGLIFFYIGFIVGTIIDAIFYRIYKKIDPNEKDNKIIFYIVSIQIFVLLVIQIIVNRIPIPNGYDMIHSVFDLGYILSQFYMAQFAIEKLSNVIYDRHEPERSSLLEKVPGIGTFFENTHEEKIKMKNKNTSK